MRTPSIRLRPNWPNLSTQESVLHQVQRSIGRPSVRWVAFGLAVFVSLALFGPLLHVAEQRPLLIPGPQQTAQNSPWKPPIIHRPSPSPPTLWSRRADQVKDAYKHAYSGYSKFAAPFDELLPVTGGKVNNFNGWAVTIVDSLDTMLIMDLREEFLDSIPIIARTTFSLPQNHYVSFFETVIRYLGGLLSAYAISGEPILLSRSDDLGRKLLPALNTTSGLPWFEVNTETGQTRAGWSGSVIWAEALSCQMEFKYLAHLTGRTEYYHKVEKSMTIMQGTHMADGMGLLPTMWDFNGGTPKNSHYSVGAFSDSAYEYFLKQWLLTGRSESKAKDLYISSATGIITNLLYLTPKRKLLYVTDLTDGIPSHTFEHLSCFLPGLFALAARTLPLSPRNKQLHEWAAKGLANTCWITYADQASGLGPDEMAMERWPGPTHAGRWIDHVETWEKEGSIGGVPPGLHNVTREDKENRDYYTKKTSYLLRPETVESFYLLWRTTGDDIWRNRGWSVFEAIEKHTRTEYGYASLLNVDISPVSKKDEMPSYFLAETLKYLYLLFTEAELIPLDKWVFNTEAHPLPIFDWYFWEKEEYHLS